MRLVNIRHKPIKNKPRVDNIKGEPNIAPCAISKPACFLNINEDAIATTGIIVSGSVVPITAKMPPMALFPNFILFPAGSIAFVKSEQTKIIIAKQKSIKIP